jgi:hypothetical protein
VGFDPTPAERKAELMKAFANPFKKEDERRGLTNNVVQRFLRKRLSPQQKKHMVSFFFKLFK